MNEYDVFLKLKADREAGARGYRDAQFAIEAQTSSGRKPGLLRVLATRLSAFAPRASTTPGETLRRAAPRADDCRPSPCPDPALTT